MNLKNIKLSKKSDKRVHTLGFHLHEVLELAKLICGDKNRKWCLWWRAGTGKLMASEARLAQGNFLGWQKYAVFLWVWWRHDAYIYQNSLNYIIENVFSIKCWYCTEHNFWPKSSKITMQSEFTQEPMIGNLKKF